MSCYSDKPHWGRKGEDSKLKIRKILWTISGELKLKNLDASPWKPNREGELIPEEKGRGFLVRGKERPEKVLRINEALGFYHRTDCGAKSKKP